MGRLTIASLAVLFALGWQYTTVTVNYGGNWTGLYCTAGRRPVPPQLAGEQIYTFAGSDGFDAQFYHYIAHDPLPGPMTPYVEAARMRYRRILLPAIAWAAAFGRQSAIHLTYIASGMFFLFLGMWWTGQYSLQFALPPAWVLSFAALPASLIFVDRLTVDHVLAAFTVGFAIFAARLPSWQLYVILLLAPFAREIGLLLTAAYCLCCWIQGRRNVAMIFATTAVPFGIWNLYLALVTEPAPYETTMAPLSRWLYWLTHPPSYPADVPLATLVRVGDVLALLGIGVAIGIAGILAIRRRSDPAAIAALLFALLAVFVQRDDVWQTVYNYGRIHSPLLILVVLGWLPLNRRLAALPLALIVPRVLMQYGRQVQGVLERVAGG